MSQAGTLKCCDLAAGQQQRMQLPGTTPPVKKQLWKIRRFSRVANIKIFFPLFMRKANAERIQNHFCSLTITHKAPEGVSPGGFAML